MSDDTDALERLAMAKRLHGAAMPVVETLLLPRDGAVSIRDLHYMCGVAERVERAADGGPDDKAFLDLLSMLMQRTEEVRSYVDERLLDGRYRVSDLIVLKDIKRPDALLRAKWELMRVTALALEDAGLTVADVAGDVGEAAQVLQRWLDGIVHDVTLDRLAGLYAVAAERTNDWPLAWLIGGKPGEPEPGENEIAELEGITAGIKLSRAIERAESSLLRHGTRIVATPGTVGGQVRIDGTRMPIAHLLIYMRGGMTESEISQTWSHLPPGWFDAIIAWIDAQQAPEDGE